MTQTAHTGNALAIGENCTANTYIIQHAADERLLALLLTAEANNARLTDRLLQALEENTRLRLALAGIDTKALTKNG